MAIWKKKYEWFCSLFAMVLCQSMCLWAEQKYELRLSSTEAQVLRNFVHTMFWSSEMGYVLYGDKPMCFVGYDSGREDPTGTLDHYCSVAFGEGVRVWKQLQLPNITPKFLLLMHEYTEAESPYSKIVMINRSSFKKVFDENASLFKHVLGPHVTADKLLLAIQNSADDFTFILKRDKVLIGLLLGFGLENALHVSRTEVIREKGYSQALRETSPFAYFFADKQHHTSFLVNPLPPFLCESELPSIGYSSLKEELVSLENETEVGSPRLEEYAPNLVFGRVSAPSSATLHLVKSYEDTQLEIINILEQEFWFEKVLSDLLQKEITIQINDSKNDVSHKIVSDHAKDRECSVAAQAIYSKYKQLADNTSKGFEQFLEGMTAAEERDAIYVAPFVRNRNLLPNSPSTFIEGFIQWSHYKLNRYFTLKSVVDNLKALYEGSIPLLGIQEMPFAVLKELHAQNFAALQKNELLIAQRAFNTFNLEMADQNGQGIQPIVKDRLYYRQIKPGNGSQISFDSLLNVAYILKSVYGNVIEDHREGVLLDLQRTFRCFRESFSKMRVGESGILYIHPEWGWKNYYSPPFFSPFLIAEFVILPYEQDNQDTSKITYSKA